MCKAELEQMGTCPPPLCDLAFGKEDDTKRKRTISPRMLSECPCLAHSEELSTARSPSLFLLNQGGLLKSLSEFHNVFFETLPLFPKQNFLPHFFPSLSGFRMYITLWCVLPLKKNTSGEAVIDPSEILHF